ncbi:MAG TPA: IS1182 family transposase [Burkholderiales bacterium]|nr:IS1182 family transposase [Burkholderiales bacterium]
MANFRPIDRATPFLLPPSVEDWLPKDHLARFVVDIVDQLDLSGLTRQYRGAGSAAYHPTVMLGLLVYGYATGVYSSRRIEAASYESIAFRYIAANEQPDHDSLCAFRKRFLKEIEALFVQVLCIARQMKLLRLGTIALDGTKIHANASRHSALSYGHAQKIEAQLEAEVKELLARAEAADQEPLPEGVSVPEELTRREERLAAIRQAKAQIEARAAERDAREQAEYEAKMKAREEKAQRTGKKPGGKPPAAPSPGVRPTDQINLTDADSRIMPAKGEGFDQSYNAQAAVDTESMLVVAINMAQVATDKQQIEPMLKELAGLPAQLGRVEQLLADNGYFSAANVEICAQAQIEPLLAAGRDKHHPNWEDRFTEPPPLTEPASVVERMKHRLKTLHGRKLYGLRKHTVEPVFGIIKSVMRFRQFLLRGLAAVRGEWSLVTMAWNIKRMAVMAG